MGELGDPGRLGEGRAFVGRDREVAELAAALEDAAGGRGRLFLVTGEPGIGKTCLAEHLAERALQRGVRVLWGRCWEGGGAPPFWPWAQLITALAEGCDDETLAMYLGAGASSIAQVVPGLTDRLGTTAAAPVPSLESDAARFYLFNAVTGFFKEASSAQPLLLVLDDLHAADDLSLLLLRFLARDLRGGSVLVVGLCREVEAERRPGIGEAVGDLVREGQLVSLRGLDREDVKALIEGLSGVVASEAKIAAIHQATEGNPLFVREAVRLLASGATVEHPGRGGVPIPGSVRAVIRRRLAPLSADAVQVLSAAAVVGREFDLSLVGPAGELPVERVLGCLSEAVALGVVAEEPGAADRYRFSHSLVREVVYDRLPIPVRMQLHRRVGEAIERLYGAGSGAHVAELARHFAEVAVAGEAAKALEYARRAGDRAMETHAYEEAAAQYERALQVLEFAGPHEALRCELLLRLGEARSRVGDHEQARASYLQAAEISRTSGSHEQLGNAALGYGEPQVEGGLVDSRLVSLLQEALGSLSPEDSPLRARLLARLSLELTFSEGMERRDSLSQQAVAMAARVGDPTARSSALRARWMAVWGPTGLDERSTLAEEILRLARETGDRATELAGRARRTTSSIEAGHIHAAEADIAAHARLAAELRMPFHRWTAATMRAMGALLRGDLGEAEKLADAALSMQPERPNARFALLDQLVVIRWEQGRLGELREAWQGFVEQFPGVGFARGWLSLAEAEQGRDDDARRGLRSLIDDLPRLPRDGLWLPALALASLLAARLEAADGTASLYPLLLPYADRTVAITMPHPVVCLGSASLYLALLAAVASRWDEANSHFQTALRVNDRLGAAAFLARTRYEYARMLIRRGQAADRGKALQLLDRAVATARTLGLAQVAQEISALREIGTGGTVTRVADEASATTEAHVFRREGDFWTVAYGGSVVRVRDSKGLRHLARLLAQPAREFHVVDLEAAESKSGQEAGSERSARAGAAELQVRPDLGDAGELLDATAKAAYKARVEELRAELEEAEGFNDPGRAAKARQELDFLVGELARAVGLGGRDRRAASHAERARLNATRAIRAA
ncbi:MAG TPA: BREX system ATP-binding domain-containing protein, partial [Actinomycetes bacterium]|nr:BREX system ATP-binding domain-containing protein [Actinomycetes bacterium]